MFAWHAFTADSIEFYCNQNWNRKMKSKIFLLSILNVCFIQKTLTNFLFHIKLNQNIRDLLLLFDRKL